MLIDNFKKNIENFIYNKIVKFYMKKILNRVLYWIPYVPIIGWLVVVTLGITSLINGKKEPDFCFEKLSHYIITLIMQGFIGGIIISVIIN